MKRRARGVANCIAVIGDMVGSRKLSAQRRASVQLKLEQAISGWNQSHRRSVLAEFTITTGDEFQGLLKNPDCLLVTIRSLEQSIPDVAFRFGVGFGTLFTELRPIAVGMDGPVWHQARAAIVRAKEQGQLGGVFEGFGEDTMALNALARFLHYHYSSMTQQQRAVADLFRSGCSVTEISQQLDIAATNVSRQKKAIAWPMLHEGESALQALLERFNCENDWA